MSLRDVRWISVLFIFVGGILALFGAYGEKGLQTALGFLIALAGLALDLWKRRCPHCGSYLFRLTPWIGDYCPSCGEKIDWDKKVSWRK